MTIYFFSKLVGWLTDRFEFNLFRQFYPSQKLSKDESGSCSVNHGIKRAIEDQIDVISVL